MGPAFSRKPVNLQTKTEWGPPQKKRGTHMKRLLTLLFAVGISFSTWAQKQLSANEVAKLETEIEAQASKINTIKSQFKQVKHVNGMSKDLNSNGDMMYKKDNKVILNYTTPIKYQMVLNGTKVKMVNGGKSKVYDTNAAGASTNEMQKMISSCMTGDMKALKKDYKLLYFEQGQNYLVKIVPNANKKLFKEIEMEMQKSDKMLLRLRLVENPKAGKKGEDYTEYQFSNTQKNVNLQDNLFAIE